MKRAKYLIGFFLLFMVIGFASVSISLSINGNVNVLSDLDDFKVYFSDVKVNGKKDLSIVNSDKEFAFSVNLRGLGSTYVIDYDITNASSVFDASLSINCTQGDDLLSITNVFDTSTNLEAKSTRSGNLTLKKLKANTNESDSTYPITCSITATAVGRDIEGIGETPGIVQPIILSTGDIISINGENFNVISQTEDTVTMLAQYNLGTDYRQSTTENPVTFSDSNGWEYTPGPKEIDIQTWSTNPKTYVNEYVSYLKSETGVNNLKGDLITIKQLQQLDCYFHRDDYAAEYTLDARRLECSKSIYSIWLVNDQNWWTRSAISDFPYDVWSVPYDGDERYLGDPMNVSYYAYEFGVRPVITIPINVARKYKVKTYEIGEVVSIGDDYFNVISDNGDTITMLARYHLDRYNRQYHNNGGSNEFGYPSGWEYTPGPKDIDIQVWANLLNTSVNDYLSYLQTQIGDSTLKADLITLKQLKKLGCTIQDDYSKTGNETCANSPYSEWLLNGWSWWTRSALPTIDDEVWDVGSSGTLSTKEAGDILSYTRPIIIISKEVLEKNIINFTIDCIAYKAYEVMYWSEWVDSPFNNAGYVVEQYDCNFRVI